MDFSKNTEKIYLPLEYNGELGKVVFKVAHSLDDVSIYWHLDEQYIGQTKEFHELAIQPSIGNHKLTLIDEKGHQLTQYINILHGK